LPRLVTEAFASVGWLPGRRELKRGGPYGGRLAVMRPSPWATPPALSVCSSVAGLSRCWPGRTRRKPRSGGISTRHVPRRAGRPAHGSCPTDSPRSSADRCRSVVCRLCYWPWLQTMPVDRYQTSATRRVVNRARQTTADLHSPSPDTRCLLRPTRRQRRRQPAMERRRPSTCRVGAAI
jgi:hypothetical protein